MTRVNGPWRSESPRTNRVMSLERAELAVDGMAPTPTRSRRGVKLAERLAKEVVVEITRSHLRPGDRLPSEVRMAQEMGVSRTVLREALRILEVHGLITIKSGPNGGPELVQLTSQDFARMATLHFHGAGVTFRQLLDARLVLEPRMAELAAVRRTDDQIQALEENLRAHEAASRVDDMAHLAHEFHGLVSACGGSDNLALALMTSSMYDIFDIIVSQHGHEQTIRQTLDDHTELMSAIKDSDPQSAATTMERHMRHLAEKFAEDHPTLVDQTVPWLVD